jgi:hypothetical protein
LKEKQAKTMARRAIISEKALLASYKVSEIVAKLSQKTLFYRPAKK